MLKKKFEFVFLIQKVSQVFGNEMELVLTTQMLVVFVAMSSNQSSPPPPQLFLPPEEKACG